MVSLETTCHEILSPVKKKSAKIFLTYLTRMLERLKLDSCESVSNSPRKDWRNALWINLFVEALK